MGVALFLQMVIELRVQWTLGNAVFEQTLCLSSG